jgi:hypothetical protein
MFSVISKARDVTEKKSNFPFRKTNDFSPLWSDGRPAKQRTGNVSDITHVVRHVCRSAIAIYRASDV